MSEFKIGTRVTLLKHEDDTDMNLEIGDTGTVDQVYKKRIGVIWDGEHEYQFWWVNASCITEDVELEENE